MFTYEKYFQKYLIPFSLKFHIFKDNIGHNFALCRYIPTINSLDGCGSKVKLLLREAKATCVYHPSLSISKH